LTISRYAVLTAFIILSACNSTPQSSQANIADTSAKGLLITSSPLTTAEIERLRIACEAWYDSVLKLRGFNGGIVVAKKGSIVFEAYNGSGRPGGTDALLGVTVDVVKGHLEKAKAVKDAVDKGRNNTASNR